MAPFRRLMMSRITPRMLRFCVVGASGLAVNMGILILLTEKFHFPYLLSSLIAIEISILTNFALNNMWTWSDRHGESVLRRMIKYHTVAGMTAFAGNWLLLVLLTELCGVDYRVANIIGIAAGVMLNFFLNNLWTFRTASGAVSEPAKALPEEQLCSVPMNRLPRVVLVSIALLTVAKLYFAARAELFVEEAYYWNYLQHPALSYFDHPPMVAWIIGVGTFVFGDTELGVRLGTILLSLASSGVLFLVARLWFGATCAWWSTLLFNLIPLYIGIGLLAFPDGPLVFFWLLTLYFVSKAIGAGVEGPAAGAAPRGSNWWWPCAGVALGGALLSKYTAIMLVPSLALFFLTSKRYRSWLGRAQPWLMLFVALAVFSPVIIWNAENQWASFLFQSTRTSTKRMQSFREISEFWGIQILILGPVIFALLVMTVRKGFRVGWLGGQHGWNFCISFFLPLFLTFFLASFKTDIHVNWTVPAFLSLLIGAGALLQEFVLTPGATSSRWWRRFAWTVPVVAILFVALVISIVTTGVPAKLAPSRIGGWRRLTEAVQKSELALQNATGQKPFFIGADRYNIASQVAFYMRAPDECVNDLAFGQRSLGFKYWTDLNRFAGRPAVVALESLHPRTMLTLSNHFEQVGLPRQTVIESLPGRTRKYWLVDCQGYRLSR